MNNSSKVQKALLSEHRTCLDEIFSGEIEEILTKSSEYFSATGCYCNFYEKAYNFTIFLSILKKGKVFVVL